jgi:hypothetical protein
MERSQLFDLMGELQLYGMKAAFDEIMATVVKRQHEPTVLTSPALSATSLPRNSCAREISGWRCLGSFSGRGRPTMWEREPQGRAPTGRGL